MATTYPTTIDDFTNPSPSDQVGIDVGGRTHSEFHSDNNDAIEALQTKVGVDGSAVTTTHDYKLSSVTASAKAVSTTGNQSVAGVKTFTDAGGVVATSAVLTTPKVITSINDTNGNELVKVTATTSAVNEITIANAATGANPSVSATGDDSNIGIDVNTKGTGTVNVKGNSTQAGEVRIYEDTDNGSNYSGFKVGSQAASIDYTLPTAVGAANTFLTDAAGNGVLSWTAVSAATTATVSLSSADILALHTTPITLVAAPGSGKVIVVDTVTYSLTAGVPYVSGGGLEVYHDGLTNTLVNGTNTAQLNSATSTIWSKNPNGTVSMGDASNKSVTLSTGTAYITGTGTLKVFVTYKTLTL